MIPAPLRGQAARLRRGGARLRLALRGARARLTDPEFARLGRESPLVCVVAGMEHSGTTLASQLLHAHPRVAAGVECGLLLSHVADFDRVAPFWDWLLGTTWGWGLTEADRALLLEARSYDEAYRMLGRFKGRAYADPELRAIFARADLIYDKTPRYVYFLDRIMDRTDRPFVVTLKTPREMAASMKRRGAAVPATLARYDRALEATLRAARRHPGRLLIVPYRTLAAEPERAMARVAGFVGLDDGHPLTLDAYNARFGRLIRSGNSFRSDRVGYAPPEDAFDAEERAAIDAYARRRAEGLAALARLA